MDATGTPTLAEVLAQKTAEIEASGLCDWGYRESGPASLNHVLDEVDQRRAAQDRQWGGPDHDSTHGPDVWAMLMKRFICRSENESVEYQLLDGTTNPVDWEKYESLLVDVAALAVAAVQVSRRKRNA